MNKIRIKYTKESAVKYISHLDMTRVFDRCIRRSKIPVSFSKGFNPRPNMNFALPTSVGISSLCEFAEFELDEKIKTSAFISVLNDNLPKGIRVKDAWYADDCSDSLMSLVTKAKYKIILKHKEMVDINAIEAVFDLEEIIVTKFSPKKTIDVDIKPMIIEYNIFDLGKQDELNLVEIKVFCLAGSKSNLRPELVVSAIEKYSMVNVYDYEIEKEEVILR